MTREELKKTLASKGNLLAKEAISSINSGEPLSSLKKIVASGAADRHYYRDPLHPRSRYRVVHVLDTCFDSSFGPVSGPLKGSALSGGFTLGHISATPGRAPYFSYLLDAGFSPGTNGYRGELFSAIMKSCFYRDPSESCIAIELATILVAKGKVDIQNFAEQNYEWTGSESKLRTVLSLGARPSGKMIDCALNFCTCAQYQGDPSSGRADVIRILLDYGATPEKAIGRLGSSKEQMAFLTKHGLESRIPSIPPVLPPSSSQPANATAKISQSLQR
jgi:hypothetical protein